MIRTERANMHPPVPSKPAPRNYWRGFSVCLFIVLLSVFTWVVQRRLAQYESIQQAGGHHMAATKVCLTDRNQFAGVSVHTVRRALEGSAAFLLIAFATMFALATPSVQPGPEWNWLKLRGAPVPASMPGLTFFFFLPPPSRFAVS